MATKKSDAKKVGDRSKLYQAVDGKYGSKKVGDRSKLYQAVDGKYGSKKAPAKKPAKKKPVEKEITAEDARKTMLREAAHGLIESLERIRSLPMRDADDIDHIVNVVGELSSGMAQYWEDILALEPEGYESFRNNEDVEEDEDEDEVDDAL